MHIINPVTTETLTAGEKYTLDQKLKKLLVEDECFIYVQPLMNGLKPDFVLIGKDFGIIIIEVKDWSDNYIKNANKKIITCYDKTYKNPNIQVKLYKGIITSKLTNIVDFIDDEGELTVPIKSLIFYVNLTQKAIKKNPDLLDYDTHCFDKKMLRTLTHKELIEQQPCAFDNTELKAIRASLFPEISIPKTINIDPDECLYVKDIRALDNEQEEFAKKIPNGHYMVSGIPGSGKTIILLARAIHLAQSNQDFNIIILTYTKALANKLKLQLKVKAIEMQISSGIVHKIEIKHFHKLCYDLVGYPSQPREQENECFYNEFWPREAIKAVTENSKYNAVLVDEYQDFHTDWFELCKKICKKTSDGKENLFFAGDRLQRIYDITWNSYKEIGINIQGRSKLLKIPYRTNPNHMDFALKFLSIDEILAKDIRHFYELENLNSVSILNNNIYTLKGSINDIIIKQNISPEDILILCHSQSECKNILNSLPLNLQSQFITGKIPTIHQGLITTYHSSKGLEAKYCILTKVEKFEINKKNRILMYVGMTRASEKLIIHFENNKNFAQEITEILI